MMNTGENELALREDSDPYCLLWVGILILASYYTHFFYLMTFNSFVITSVLVEYSALPVVGLLVLPILLVFTMIGYLKPEKGKTKQTMFSLTVVFGLFHLVFSLLAQMVWNSADMMSGVGLSSWGVGAALLVAGGFSIMQPLEESIWYGMLDVKRLHYGPEPEYSEATSDAPSSDEAGPSESS